MATVTAAQQLAVANLYSALFNRAPDAAGFTFWAQALADGASLFSIAATFVATPEAKSTYAAAQTAEQYVALYYTTVFGRTPDAGGLAFWTASLNAAGGVGSDTARAWLVTQIIDTVSTPLLSKPGDLSDAQYAQTLADRSLFTNKSTVGVYFASDLKSTDLNLAKQVLGAVTAEPASIEVAKGIATGTPVNGGGGGGGPVVVPTYYLTKGTDTLVGTDGADIFVAGYDDGPTVSAGDSIDGGAGIDRLNLSDENIYVFAMVSMRNVELIYTDMGGGEFDIAGNADVRELWLESPYAGNRTITLRKDQLFVWQGATLSFINRLEFTDSAGSADTAKVGLVDSTGGARLTIRAIESLTIDATGTNALQWLTAEALETLVLTGTGKLKTSAGASGTYKVVDASAISGGLTFDVSGLATTDHRIIGSAAQDEITINSANLTAADDIDLGAGQDTLGFSVGNVLLDGSTATNFSGIKNVEAFKFNGSVNASVDGGLTQASAFIVNTTGNAMFTRLDSTDTVMIGGVTAAANSYNLATGQSVFNLIMNGSDTAVASAVNQLVGNSTNINIASSGSAGQGANVLSITTIEFNTFFVRGTQDLTLGVTNASGDTGHTIDASGFSGKLNVRGTFRTDTITGGTGDDIIDGGEIAFPGSFAVSTDTLTGGAGADTFVFSTADHNTAHGGLTAIITDFKSGQDKIKVANIGAATAGNFASVQTSTPDLAALLTAADTALDGTVKIYVGWVGIDAYVVTDMNGVGYTDVIKLSGVGTSGVVAADFIA
jgi:hypothetical protein